jgi:O-methyltransferase involved in polyketide biosynthesis
MTKTVSQNLTGISETLLIPLYARALESQRPDAMLKDDKAVELVERINYDFSRARVQAHDEVAIIMRMREFDRFARDFLARNPDAVVVHIGCGLDTRFERVDNGRLEWYDLDLPHVIKLRRELMGEETTGRYHLLGVSVFEDDWLEAVSIHRQRPFLFLAEGVLPYFEEAQVKSLFLKLRDQFPGAEFVFDGMAPFVIWADNLQLKHSKMDARLHWGLKSGKDIEAWDDAFTMLDEWYYFDHPEPRLGAYQWIRYFPAVAKSSGIFHYRLGKSK